MLSQMFAQLNKDGTFNRIVPVGNIEWDSSHFCKAEALTQDEKTLFRVVPVVEIPAPEFDQITQECANEGAVKIDGVWKTKWVIKALSPEQIEINKQKASAALISKYEKSLDNYIDSVAKADRWESRLTCVARASYPNTWQTKAIAFGIWMDSCYVLAYQIMADVQAGLRELPSLGSFIAEMPSFEWPE